MSDTAVAEPPAETAETTEKTSKAIATFKRPGVFIKLYPKTTKDGKSAVFGRFSRRRQKSKTGEWEDNDFVNSMNDLDFIMEACVEAKQYMREFYRDRDAKIDDNGEE